VITLKDWKNDPADVLDEFNFFTDFVESIRKGFVKHYS